MASCYNLLFYFCNCSLLSRHQQVIEDESLPDEFLVGRVGYLFSLLFLRHHIGVSAVDSLLVDKVGLFIIVVCQRQDLPSMWDTRNVCWPAYPPRMVECHFYFTDLPACHTVWEGTVENAAFTVPIDVRVAWQKIPWSCSWISRYLLCPTAGNTLS